MTQTIQPTLFGLDEPPAPPVAGLFADVVFDRPLDHAFTYAVGADLKDSIAVGKRVRAPFGRGDRTTIGYCVRLTETPPAAAGQGTGRSPRRRGAARRPPDAPDALDGRLLPLRLGPGAECGGAVRRPQAVRHPCAGFRRGRRRRPRRRRTCPPSRPPSSSTCERRVCRSRCASCRGGCAAAPVRSRRCWSKGLIRRHTRRVDRFLDTTEEPAEPAGPITLNADQVGAWAVLEPALHRAASTPSCCTASPAAARRRLYLRAIEEVVRQGKEALVLVPEISLTPQTIARFRGRCGEVAVLHSHLGDAERGGHWRRIAAGQVQVVVGARSAVFAPTRKLGLIVIDEEHESTFKQESTPRYHARDVAVMRARLENIPILLGSATPSLESWHNAQRGQYTLLTLPQRVLDRPMPPVTLIDLRHEEPRARPVPGPERGAGDRRCATRCARAAR